MKNKVSQAIQNEKSLRMLVSRCSIFDTKLAIISNRSQQAEGLLSLLCTRSYVILSLLLCSVPGLGDILQDDFVYRKKDLTFENVANQVRQNKAYKAAKEPNIDKYQKGLASIN